MDATSTGSGKAGGGGGARRELVGHENKLVKKLALTGTAAALAETGTFPIDTLKTRMQLQGEGVGRTMASSRFSALGMARHIVATEGVSAGLYSGVGAGMLRHAIYTPSRIVLYETFRGVAARDRDTSSLPLYEKAALGFAAGMTGQLLASPADLVKIRMQADARLPAHERRYRNVAHALRQIHATEGGFASLFRGVRPNLARAGLVNMGELASYDHAKQLVLSTPYFEKDGVYAHTAASVISGLLATVFSCPADVVKSRIMNASEGTYVSIVDCLTKTVRHEGVFALYSGFWPTWSRLGPWQFVFWVSYERARALCGMDSF
ncbi:mitochondrial uncoupling protein [Pseudoscourfieldia marina]